MGEGGVGLPWIHHYFFLTSVHFTRGIISHHTRNNRPFQPFFFSFFFLFLFFFFTLWHERVRGNPSTPLKKIPLN